tara:strand:- start:1037 stop:1201 length:165 start_codon:yes stop_codon:yes gene_type:complete
MEVVIKCSVLSVQLSGVGYAVKLTLIMIIIIPPEREAAVIVYGKTRKIQPPKMI